MTYEKCPHCGADDAPSSYVQLYVGNALLDTPRPIDIHVIDGKQCVLRQLSQTQEKLAIAQKGLQAVVSLINESHGVAGLHLNGDVATWPELRTGGQFEEWLYDFDGAIGVWQGITPPPLIERAKKPEEVQQ